MKAEEEEAAVEKEEGEAARRKEGAGDGGKVVLRFDIAGKSWAVERGRTEEEGSGERGSGDAEGGRRFWHVGRCTGGGETGEEGETASCWGECLVETGRRFGAAGNTAETAC